MAAEQRTISLIALRSAVALPPPPNVLPGPKAPLPTEGGIVIAVKVGHLNLPDLPTNSRFRLQRSLLYPSTPLAQMVASEATRNRQRTSFDPHLSRSAKRGSRFGFPIDGDNLMPNKSSPNTGVIITGSTVNTGGGDIIGGNKILSISATQLNDLFDPVRQSIASAPPDLQAAATAKLHALKNEVEKGTAANDTILAKLVDGLVALIPSAVAGVVSAFASPLLAGIAGPATKYVLGKITGK